TSTMVQRPERKACATLWATPSNSCERRMPCLVVAKSVLSLEAASANSLGTALSADWLSADSQALKGVSALPSGTYHFLAPASQRAPSAFASSFSLKGTLR